MTKLSSVRARLSSKLQSSTNFRDSDSGDDCYDELLDDGTGGVDAAASSRSVLPPQRRRAPPLPPSASHSERVLSVSADLRQTRDLKDLGATSTDRRSRNKRSFSVDSSQLLEHLHEKSDHGGEALLVEPVPVRRARSTDSDPLFRRGLAALDEELGPATAEARRPFVAKGETTEKRIRTRNDGDGDNNDGDFNASDGSLDLFDVAQKVDTKKKSRKLSTKPLEQHAVGSTPNPLEDFIVMGPSSRNVTGKSVDFGKSLGSFDARKPAPVPEPLRSEELDNFVDAVRDARAELRRQVQSPRRSLTKTPSEITFSHLASEGDGENEDEDESSPIKHYLMLVDSFHRLAGSLRSVSDTLELIASMQRRMPEADSAAGASSTILQKKKASDEERLKSLSSLLSHTAAIDVVFSSIGPYLTSVSSNQASASAIFQLNNKGDGDKVVRTSKIVDMLTEVANRVNEVQEWTEQSETVYCTLLELLQQATDEVQADEVTSTGSRCKNVDNVWTVTGTLCKAWTKSGHTEQLKRLEGAFEEEAISVEVLFAAALEVVMKCGDWCPSQEDLVFVCNGHKHLDEADGGDRKSDRNRKDLVTIPVAASAVLNRIGGARVPRKKEIDRILKLLLPLDSRGPESGNNVKAREGEAHNSENVEKRDVATTEVVVISSAPEDVEESSASKLSAPGKEALGKTTLAAMVASREDIRSFYNGGIVWLNVGHFCIDIEMYCRYLRAICRQLNIAESNALNFPQQIGGSVNENSSLMSDAKAAMSCLLKDRNTLIILDDVQDYTVVDWFCFHSAPSFHDSDNDHDVRTNDESSREDDTPIVGKVLITTQCRGLLTEKSVEIGPLEEEEALEVLVTEAGQFANRATATLPEAERIVLDCQHHPLLLKTAGRYIRLKQEISGVDLMASFEKVARSIRSISETVDDHSGPSLKTSRDMEMLCAMLGLSLSAFVPRGKENLVELCLAAFAIVFCSPLNDDWLGRSHGIPMKVVKVLWERLLLDHGLQGDDLNKIILAIPEVLTNMGVIAMRKHDSLVGTGDMYADFCHNMHRRYAFLLAADSGDLVKSFPNVKEGLLNELFVSSFLAILKTDGSYNWNDSVGSSSLHYALEMIVSHMLRAGRLTQAASILKDASFIKARMFHFRSTYNGTQKHVSDCEEFSKKLLDDELAKEDLDPKDEIVLAYDVVSSFLASRLEAREPKVNESVSLVLSFNAIGSSLSKMRCWKDALKHFESALALVSADPEDKNLRDATYWNASVALEKLGSFNRALDCQMEVLRIRQVNLAHRAERIAESMIRVGRLRVCKGEYEDGLSLFNEVLSWEMNGRVKGDAFFNKGRVLDNMGDMQGSMDCFERCLNIQIEMFGENHDILAPCYCKMGTICSQIGRQEEATKHFEEAIRVMKLKNEKADEDIAFILFCEAAICGTKGEQSKALELASLACQIFRSERYDLKVADVYVFLGDTNLRIEDNEQAEMCYEEASSIIRDKLGENHLAIAPCLQGIGNALASVDDEEERALKFFHKAEGIYKETIGDINERVASLAHQIGMLHVKSGDHEQAIEHFKKELRTRVALHGDSHDSVITNLIDLGIAHDCNRNYAEAMECFKQVEQIRRQSGDDRLDVADIVSEIGRLHEKLFHFDEALECQKEVLRIKQANLDPQVEQIAESMIEVARLRVRKGELDDAQRMFEEVLSWEITERDRLKKGDALLYLGRIHLMRGELDNALLRSDKALREKSAVLDGDHENLADIYRQIAQIFEEKGSCDEAIPCFEEAIRLKKIKVDKSVEEVADLLMLEGNLFACQSKWDIALDRFKSASGILKSTFGRDNETVAHLLHLRARLFVKKGTSYNNRAIQLFEEGLGISRKVFGVIHFDVASVLYDLSRVYFISGMHEDALKYAEEALRIFKILLGDSEKAAATYEMIGNIHRGMDDYANAKSQYIEALNIRKKVHGERHVSVAQSLYSLGQCTNESKEYDESIAHFSRCLDIRQEKLGEDHVEVAACHYSMGVTFYYQELYHKSFDCFTKALQIQRTFCGDDSTSFSDTLSFTGLARFQLGDDSESLDLLWESIRLNRIVEDHWREAATLSKISMIHVARDELTEAIMSLEDRLQIRKEELRLNRFELVDDRISLAKLEVSRGNATRALMHYEEALETMRAEHGDNDRRVGDLFEEVGILSFKVGDRNKGEQALKEFVRIRKLFGRENDGAVANAYFTLGNAHGVKKETDCAISCWTKALVIYKEIGLPDDHPCITQLERYIEEGVPVVLKEESKLRFRRHPGHLLGLF